MNELEMKLVQCPFCGSNKIGGGYNGQPAISFYFSCGDCGARGPVIERNSSDGKTEWTFALEEWNRRDGGGE